MSALLFSNGGLIRSVLSVVNMLIILVALSHLQHSTSSSSLPDSTLSTSSSTSSSSSSPSVEITYPSPATMSQIFTGSNAKYLSTFDWRLGGSWVFDIDLARNKGYTSIAKSSKKEDIHAYELWFYGLRNGVVLEVGAGDGLENSASFLFEKFASWVAFNIEKEGDFNKLKLNRPNAYNINADASKFSGNGLELNNIMKTLQLRHIDVCFLRAGGFELKALESLDIEYTHVNAFVISCNREDQEAIFSRLSKYDYDCVTTNSLCMCMNKWYRPSAMKNIIV